LVLGEEKEEEKEEEVVVSRLPSFYFAYLCTQASVLHAYAHSTTHRHTKNERALAAKLWRISPSSEVDRHLLLVVHSHRQERLVLVREPDGTCRPGNFDERYRVEQFVAPPKLPPS
jgi:hypothetical protein